jgi:hypothetical protein
MSENALGHAWRFYRVGGFDQVRLDSGADIAALETLDRKLWVALACPTKGLEFDTRTLELIDADKDGRIRVPEILEAIRWTVARLKTLDDLLHPGTSFPLDAIHDGTPEGQQALASARQILIDLGKPNEAAITLEDTKDTAHIFAQTRFNGDGIVPADSADDPALKSAIENVIDCMGAETDRSGKAGVSQPKADQFFADARAYLQWWAEGETQAASLQPLGERTAAASTAVVTLKAKLDDYFARCQLASYDERASAALNRDEKEYAALAGKDLALAPPEVSSFPLARVAPGKPLIFHNGVNPAWTDAVSRLESDAVVPLLGARTELTQADWIVLQDKLAAHQAWRAAKAGASVEKLGIARVRELLSSGAEQAIAGLIAKDKALEPEANAIADVDRLIHYYLGLYRLLNNFVSFRDFYGRKEKAIFQAGTLFIDQKSCDLCLPVEDSAKHNSMAGLAGTYLLYCDCLRRATGERMQIVAAVTAGDTGDLLVGRNGVYWDRKGCDWDATVTKIIDNPISLRQAFWAPYKKFVRLIEEQVQRRAAAAEAAAHVKLGLVDAPPAAAPAAPAPAPAPPPAPAAKPAPPPEPRRLDVGVVAALGVAVGALTAAVSGFATGIMRLPGWQLPLVFVGLALLISGPSMIIAWLKLRRRNLGPILDANGWAVNVRAKVNVPFGTTLTGTARLPQGAQRDLSDPYAERKNHWPKILIIAAVIGFVIWFLDNRGLLFKWTNGWIGSRPPAAAELKEAIEKVTEKK